MESRSGTARCLTSCEGAGGFQICFWQTFLPKVTSAVTTAIDREEQWAARHRHGRLIVVN